MFKIQAVWTGVAGSPYYTNFYFAGTTDPEVQSAGQAVRQFIAAIGPALRPDLNAAIATEVPVIDPASGVIENYFSLSLPAVQMSGSGEALPPGTQALVRLRTQDVVNGRRVVGHYFIPGQRESENVAPGVPTTALQNVIGAAAQALVDNAGSQLVVYSKTGGAFGVVTTATMAPQWSSLRTRRIQG